MFLKDFGNYKILLNYYYNLDIKEINYFSREDIDYSNEKLNRKVLILDNKYVLKLLKSNCLTDLNYIFTNFKNNGFSNIIYPILNNNGKYVSNYLEYNFLLFNKKLLVDIDSSIDFLVIFERYKKFNFYLQKLNSSKLYNNYINDIEYLIVFLKKYKNIEVILDKLNLFLDIVINSLKEYKRNTLLYPIYSTFWEGNIKIDKKTNNIFFLDLDSVKIGDPFYDMLGILSFIYKNYYTERYKYYKLVVNFFIGEYGIPNIKYFYGLIFYYNFNILLSIDDRKINVILKDVFFIRKNCIDFLDFLKIEYDI